MTITLYRVDVTGDDINDRPAGEIIVFNNSLDVNTPNPFITTFDISNTTGIGNNQAAEQDLGDHQDLGPIEQMYVIRGFISQRDKINGTTPGLNSFIEILKTWDEETKTSDDFKHGRIGVQIDDMPSYNIVPEGTPSTTQVGLIWKGISWRQDYEDNPLRANFEIQLIVDKGDDQ